MRLVFSMRVSICLIVVAAFSIGEAQAQTTPEIDYVFPGGAQRGTSVDIQIGTEFVPGACRLVASGPGVAVQPLDTAGRYRINVAGDAPLGAVELRLAVTQGASAPFPFVVGELPEVIRVDRGPMPLKLPVVVNARLANGGTVNEYALDLSAGRQIVCAATTKSLQSPVDVMLRLLDPSGRLVAEGFDSRTADELLVYRAPQAGRYLLQVHDFQLGGGSRSIYRLTVTDGPWLDYAFPLGVQKSDAATNVMLHGWNLTPEGATTLAHSIPPQSSERYVVQFPKGTNRLALAVGTVPELVETEPNDDRERAQGLAFPVAVSGRLQTPGDRDVYAVALEKGTKIAVDLESTGLGFEGDPVLTLADGTGKTLQEIDDNQTQRDPKLRFTATVAGRYFLTIRDRASDGGNEFVYRLRIAAPQPDVTARVNASGVMLHSGETTNVPVIVNRLDDFSDALEVTALDLPGGVSVVPQEVPAKTPATIQLPLAVREGVAPVGGLVRIVVRSKNADKPFERQAMIAEAASATSGSASLWVAVSPKIPFTLKTTTTILDAPRLAAFPFPVTVRRAEGFTGPIRLVGVRPDQRGTVKTLTGFIPADGVEGTLPLILQQQVVEGTTHRSRVMGVADVIGADGKTYEVFHVADGNASIGCQPSLLTLTSSPTSIVWRPGDKLQLHVQLMRRKSMQPIKLRAEFDEAAVGVSCEAIDVPADRNEVVLTLNFAKDAKLPPRSFVTIHAESSSDGLPIYGYHRLRLESP